MSQVSTSLIKSDQGDKAWVEPEAPSYNFKDWLTLIDQLLSETLLMSYAKSKKHDDFQNLGQLKEFISSCPHADSQIKRAWLVYVWMTENIQYDAYVYQTGLFGELTAESTLKDGKSICEGFSNLFVELCQSVGIECHKIHGYCKGFGYEDGRQLRTRDRHAWNRVLIEEKWQLVDSTWGAGHLSYHCEKKFRPHFFFMSHSRHD